MQELEGIVSRAMRQAAQSLDTAQVPEDVFWYAQQVCLSLAKPLSLLHNHVITSCLSDIVDQQGHRQTPCGCMLDANRAPLMM